MTADALAGERLIAIGLHPDASPETDVLPLANSMLGLGKIVAHDELDDGRYVLVVRGISRARLVGEEITDRPYRVGRLEICADELTPSADFDRRQRADEIADLFGRLFPGSQFQRLIDQAMSAELPLGSVCDVIASALPIPTTATQLLLDEVNADLRSQMLWQLLKRMEPAAGPAVRQLERLFPPGFSSN